MSSLKGLLSDQAEGAREEPCEGSREGPPAGLLEAHIEAMIFHEGPTISSKTDPSVNSDRYRSSQRVTLGESVLPK